ncbi:MAG: transcriptional regulator [Micrococcales bacterium]|nr:transcriptional regulator [Micrococcales bacterium]
MVEAGYVTIRKGSDGRRKRTWARITAPGRRALRAEVQLLRQLLQVTETPRTPAP